MKELLRMPLGNASDQGVSEGRSNLATYEAALLSVPASAGRGVKVEGVLSRQTCSG